MGVAGGGVAVRELPAGGTKQSVIRQVSAALVSVLFPLLKSPLQVFNGICR